MLFTSLPDWCIGVSIWWCPADAEPIASYGQQSRDRVHDGWRPPRRQRSSASRGARGATGPGWFVNKSAGGMYTIFTMGSAAGDGIRGSVAGRVEGVTPFVVPNGEFYRIDTALTLQQS